MASYSPCSSLRRRVSTLPRRGMNVEIGADGFELSLAAQAGGADTRALGQILKAGIVARAEGVAWVFPFCDGGDFESRWKFGGQVFQRMYGEIDAAGGESVFNFFRENSFSKSAFGADHSERDVGDLVAGGVDDLDFDFVAAGAQESGDMVGLPESELRPAGTDAELRHHLRGPTSVSFAAGCGADTLSFFPQIEQAANYVDDRRCLRFFGRRLQRRDRGVHDFVDDAASQRFDGDFLLWGQGAQPAADAVDFGLADGFQMILQRHDRGHNVERLQSGLRSARLRC